MTMTSIEEAAELYELGDHACTTIKGTKSVLKLLDPIFPSYHIRKGMEYQRATFDRLQETVEIMNAVDHSRLRVKYDWLQNRHDWLLDNGNVKFSDAMTCRRWKHGARELKEGTERLSKNAESEQLRIQRKKASRQSGAEDGRDPIPSSENLRGDNPIHDCGPLKRKDESPNGAQESSHHPNNSLNNANHFRSNADNSPDDIVDYLNKADDSASDADNSPDHIFDYLNKGDDSDSDVEGSPGHVDDSPGNAPDDSQDTTDAS
ncbi:hypothetical protein A0H81_09386 [Grifola frondosa]|uniref:Uncharacterized protein n=1 Tax=Grifola frondosa TaxID=5627 RepID=A0A1C7M392_GRIFR|nr:hypothetical protein A0H81_09386 [Grifola frondosa]